MRTDDEFEAYHPINPLWRLHTFLTLREAAALVAGYEPTQVARAALDTPIDRGFPNLYPTESVLCGAVLLGELTADVVYAGEFVYVRYVGDESEGHWKPVNDQIHGGGSRVKSSDLIAWLASKGHREGFFFPDAKADAPNYLDPMHERYAPKLAAAVRAWLAIQDTGGKSAKQALTKWLREHSAEYGLSDDDGKQNETGIEQCATVANWQQSGGAPKTPGA